MKRVVLSVLFVASLSACGVDGEPIKPDVNAGVTITPNGVYPTAGVRVGQGPFSFRLGL
jgi:hypothetical protein